MSSGDAVHVSIDVEVGADDAFALKDPFGHVWIVSTTIKEDVSADEVEKATDGKYKKV